MNEELSKELIKEKEEALGSALVVMRTLHALVVTPYVQPLNDNVSKSLKKSEPGNIKE